MEAEVGLSPRANVPSLAVWCPAIACGLLCSWPVFQSHMISWIR
jgi:hypothetical protein